MKYLSRGVVSVGLFFLAQLPLSANWSCGYGGGASGGCHATMLLLALALGYGVLVLSQSQPKPLNSLGRGIGALILIISFIGLICTAICGVKRMCPQRSMCPMASHGGGEVAPPMPMDDGQQAPNKQ
jgi:hypothetical protein